MRPHLSSLALFFCFQAGLGSLQQPRSDIIAIDPPGTFIDVDGRKMHVNCVGTGRPTVVLESSFSQFAIDWWFVQPDMAKLTRVCSYDRAGLGWSERGPHLEHPEQIVADLHTLLTRAGEQPPFVFASMAMGAFYTRAYQLRYPDEVAGFVFIEPAHEDTFLLPLDGKPTPLWAVSAEEARAFAASLNKGPRPPSPPLSTGPPFDKLPGDVLTTRLAFQKRAIELMDSSVRTSSWHSLKAGARQPPNSMLPVWRLVHAR